MKNSVTRRIFLAKGLAATAASLVAGRTVARQSTTGPASNNVAAKPNTSPSRSKPSGTKFSGYSRYHPSFGGPVGSDHYLGKLVPGLRKSGLKPVPFEAPDLGKIPWKMVNGAKEFHIHCTPVKREFLPGYFMNVWGYNGSMPGPTIEAFQGDRVRFVVHNQLPEPTTIHWHGLEIPVQMDGVPGITQDLIPAGAWIPRNVTLVGVAMVQEFEFVAFNPGDWIFHCHMVHQVGPRIRNGADISEYLNALPNRPPVRSSLENADFQVPGYPQVNARTRERA